jgi:hypothetical protein
VLTAQESGVPEAGISGMIERRDCRRIAAQGTCLTRAPPKTTEGADACSNASAPENFRMRKSKIGYRRIVVLCSVAGRLFDVAVFDVLMLASENSDGCGGNVSLPSNDLS